MANIPFTAFEFAATGRSAERTMPDRLAEVNSVKDHGATGDGTTNDAAAFQAAFDAAINDGIGVVFVPAGTYKINSSINFDQDFDFGLLVHGCGTASIIDGSAINGYIFDRSLASPHNTYGPRVFRDLRIFNNYNSSTNGCIRLGSTIGGAVRNCHITAGGTAITTEDTAGSSSEAITVDNIVFAKGGSNIANSRGVVMGGSGRITGCDITALDKALTLYGGGIVVDGCRMERNHNAIILGVDSGGTARGLNGLCISGMPMEGNVIGIDFQGIVTGFTIGPLAQAGHDSSNAGVVGAAANSQYAILIRADKAFAGEFVAMSNSSWHDNACVWIEDFTQRAFVTFSGCVNTVGGGTGVPWRLSTAPMGFRFDQECNVHPGSNAPSGTRYTFGNLPAIGVRLEGDEYDISDSNTATLGATAASGGANRVRVRFNGTNWIVIA